MANFDGFPVDNYQGRFSGAFDIEPADGEALMRYGNKVMLLVLATVGTASMSEDKNGEMRRLNTLAVETARFVGADEQSDLLADLGVSHQLGLLTPVAKKPPAELVATPDGYVDEQGSVVEELVPPVSEAPAGNMGRDDDDDTDGAPFRPVDKPFPVDPEPPKDGVVGRIPPPKDPRLARFLDEAGATR